MAGRRPAETGLARRCRYVVSSVLVRQEWESYKCIASCGDGDRKLTKADREMHAVCWLTSLQLLWISVCVNDVTAISCFAHGPLSGMLLVSKDELFDSVSI